MLTIKTTEGTIVHCAWPAGVCKGTTSVTQSVWTVATQCLSQMLTGSEMYRNRAVAVARGNLMILDLMGVDQYGGPFAAVLQECCLAAGSAGGVVSDGIDTGGVSEPEVSIPNVESNEFRYPVLYLYRRQRVDSGGPGQFRGGVGLSMAFMPHGTDKIDNVMVHSHGVIPPSALGLGGGFPAVTNRLSITRGSNIAQVFENGVIPADVAELKGSVEQPPSFTYTQLAKGDVFECAGGGGGGYGDPLDRTPELCLRDVQNGVVSPDQAKARYGIVLQAGNSAVDETATEAARAAIRSARQTLSAANSAPSVVQPDSVEVGTHVCPGQSPSRPGAAPENPLPSTSVEYKITAFQVAQTVHMASYAIREVYCPACWSLLKTQVSVPQVQA